MSAPLYKLRDQWADLLAMLDRIDDEGLDDDSSTMIGTWLTQLEGETAMKFEELGRLLREIEGTTALLEEEAERLRTRALASKRKATRIKRAVMDLMALANMKQMRTRSFTFSRCDNGGKQPVVVDDVDANDVAAVRPDLVVVKTEVNKEAVRAALEAGDSLPFARFAPRGEHLKVR